MPRMWSMPWNDLFRKNERHGLLSSYDQSQSLRWEKVKGEFGFWTCWYRWSHSQLDGMITRWNQLKRSAAPGFGGLTIALPSFSKEEKKEFEKWSTSTYGDEKGGGFYQKWTVSFCSEKRLMTDRLDNFKVFFQRNSEKLHQSWKMPLLVFVQQPSFHSLQFWVLPKRNQSIPLGSGSDEVV